MKFIYIGFWSIAIIFAVEYYQQVHCGPLPISVQNEEIEWIIQKLEQLPSHEKVTILRKFLENRLNQAMRDLEQTYEFASVTAALVLGRDCINSFFSSDVKTLPNLAKLRSEFADKLAPLGDKYPPEDEERIFRSYREFWLPFIHHSTTPAAQCIRDELQKENFGYDKFAWAMPKLYYFLCKYHHATEQSPAWVLYNLQRGTGNRQSYVELLRDQINWMITLRDYKIMNMLAKCTGKTQFSGFYDFEKTSDVHLVIPFTQDLNDGIPPLPMNKDDLE